MRPDDYDETLPEQSGGGFDRYEYTYYCNDYYSTGHFRRPRRPRKHGWSIALAAMLLLLISGVALSRDISLADASAQAPASTMEAVASIAETTTGSGVTAQTLAEPQVVSEDTAPAADEDAAEAEAAEDKAAAEESQETQDESEPAGTASTDTASADTDSVLVLKPAGDGELSFQEIYKKVIPSVVSISVQSGRTSSSGTGIIITEDGYILTNYHVVSSAQAITVLLNSGEEYEAEMVGGDETSDLAVLKTDAQGLTAAEFGDSDGAEVGDTVLAIGDPLGIELRGTMTDGIICGINRDVTVGTRTMTLIQTNAALNSGNSGGPLINLQGQVIGINTMKISSENYSGVEGIGFAIPTSSAQPIVDELIASGYVTGRPDLGFSVETLDVRVKMLYGLPEGVFIDSVDEGSDAYACGIRRGDLLVEINGTAVSSVDEVETIRNQFAAGDSLSLVIYRQGALYEAEITLMDQGPAQ